VERDRGVKFCMRVGLLSGQVFFPFGEDWLVGSHGRGITFPDERHITPMVRERWSACNEPVRIGGGGVV